MTNKKETPEDNSYWAEEKKRRNEILVHNYKWFMYRGTIRLMIIAILIVIFVKPPLTASVISVSLLYLGSVIAFLTSSYFAVETQNKKIDYPWWKIWKTYFKNL